MQNVIEDLAPRTELVPPRIASPTLAAIDQLLRTCRAFSRGSAKAGILRS